MLRTNALKTIEERMGIETPFQSMTRFSDKFNAAATTLVNNDRYLGGQPWSSPVLKWNQDQYREPSNKFGYRFAEDKSAVQRYAPAGMLGQLHASSGAGMRTYPVKPKYNVSV